MALTVWSYTPGGTKLGDRIMALKPFMLEKGGQKYWNELYLFATRTIAGAAGTIVAGSSFGAIDLANTADVSAVVPKSFQDPMMGRMMPGYGSLTGSGPPPTQVFIFQGFVG